MPFDIGKAVNSIAGWVGGAPLVSSVIGNPVMTSLLLTALALIIIYAIDERGESRGRAAVYVFLAFLAVTFIHYATVARSLRGEAFRQGAKSVVATTLGQSRFPVSASGAFAAPVAPVAPPAAPAAMSPATSQMAPAR